MTCVSKSLSDLDAELLDEALLADEGREGVDPGLDTGLDFAAPESNQNKLEILATLKCFSDTQQIYDIRGLY